MTKRFGFTLAEVLITLGIIGVVAAMTIPTLISNTNGAQFKTAYKKALSTLNQAVLMNLAMDDTDFSTIDAEDTDGSTNMMSNILTTRMQSTTPITTYASTLSLKEGTATDATTPKLKYTFTCKDGKHTDGSALGAGETCAPTTGTGVGTGETTMDSDVTKYEKYAFADGTAFWYHNEANKCTQANAITNKCYGFIDVNGTNNPNTVIHCPNASTNNTCESSEITDIFPVIFHGQTVEPASDSARAVLFGK